MGQLCQVIQGEVLFKMVVDVAAYQFTLLAGPGARGLAGEGQVLLAPQLNEHHLQQMPADVLVAREGFGGLLEHQVHAAVQLGPAVVEVEHDVPRLGGSGLQALDPQDNVLKGAFQGADLGVGDVGVDDKQVLKGDGELLIQGAEMSVSVQDKKQLRAAVGVQL